MSRQHRATYKTKQLHTRITLNEPLHHLMHVFGLWEEARVLLNIQEFEKIWAQCCSRHVSRLLLSVCGLSLFWLTGVVSGVVFTIMKVQGCSSGNVGSNKWLFPNMNPSGHSPLTSGINEAFLGRELLLTGDFCRPNATKYRQSHKIKTTPVCK